ncbi:MAG: TlpA family protein disulfide reductase [Polaribacter sp.]
MNRAPIYLKNGYNIHLKGNADKFITSFKFSGKGASNSNFIIAQLNESKKIVNPSLLLNKNDKEFAANIDLIRNNFDSIRNSYKSLDTSLIKIAKKRTNQIISYFKQTYAKNRSVIKGKPSPKFKNYKDFKGGKKSLDSFLGKYVYIDVWATWCGPCKQQIPFLKKLEKEYRGKNIEFVSISVDESRRSGGTWEAAEKKWKTFVKNNQLSGVQLWCGEDVSFQQAYQINSIPRFILIDPQGKIVNTNAPRPSEPKLKSTFDSLGI